MIRVHKSTTTPVILIDKGLPEKAENCHLYSISPTDYNSGAAKFTILPSIYGDKLVKKQLVSEQHGKCCFCEADFDANGYGDVEHFRPKAGFTQTPTGKLIRPGYYWLAYDWDNLFFSCQICNQRFKKNYFPLENEAKRAINHTFDHLEELPILLHPSADNPEDHITFNRHIPVSVAKSKRGELSIVGFGINRPALNRIREAYLQNVHNNIALAGVDLEVISDAECQQISQLMHQPWEVIQDLILKAKEFVAVAASDSQPFAAMVRANFPDLV